MKRLQVHVGGNDLGPELDCHIADPCGVVWEAVFTGGKATVHGDGPALDTIAPAAGSRRRAPAGVA